jgi:hypothetical protein
VAFHPNVNAKHSSKSHTQIQGLPVAQELTGEVRTIWRFEVKILGTLQ